MWRLGTWFSGGVGSVRLTVRLNDLMGLFQLKGFYDAMIYLSGCPVWTQGLDSDPRGSLSAGHQTAPHTLSPSRVVERTWRVKVGKPVG